MNKIALIAGGSRLVTARIAIKRPVAILVMVSPESARRATLRIYGREQDSSARVP
jgi:hypothetical protein